MIGTSSGRRPEPAKPPAVVARRMLALAGAHDHDRPPPIGAARKGNDPVGMRCILAEGEELWSNLLCV
jgi:hypothetical protein